MSTGIDFAKSILNCDKNPLRPSNESFSKDFVPSFVKENLPIDSSAKLSWIFT
ncbi:hypothetical protein RhiirC2_747957, partial [Rhizophagus irregularis]